MCYGLGVFAWFDGAVFGTAGGGGFWTVVSVFVEAVGAFWRW